MSLDFIFAKHSFERAFASVKSLASALRDVRQLIMYRWCKAASTGTGVGPQLRLIPFVSMHENM